MRTEPELLSGPVRAGMGMLVFGGSCLFPMVVRTEEMAGKADVIFEVDEGLNTLVDYRYKRKFAAQDGEQGGKRRCHGKNGQSIVLKVPEGTVIMEAESRKVIADMSGENRRQIVLKGGRGTRGRWS